MIGISYAIRLCRLAKVSDDYIPFLVLFLYLANGYVFVGFTVGLVFRSDSLFYAESYGTLLCLERTRRYCFLLLDFCCRMPSYDLVLFSRTMCIALSQFTEE